ncbi:MAG: CDP-alcohol phosphatidyltransferase family protein [Thermoanaerobaculia bacterium]|nr:CDP-alcohol phosphatidyltransferase family protein [Thermoanaerobaculia bacterium]
MTIANILTSIRLLMAPLFIVASVAGRFDIAFFLFVGAALTDAVDGWLARRLNQRSRIGALLDPAADKTMLVSGYVVFTIPGIAEHSFPLGLTITVLMRDVLIVLIAYLIFTRVRIASFPPSIPGKISTIVQAVALGVTIAANMWLASIALPLLYLSHAAALVMTLYSGLHYMRRWALILE